MATGDAYELRFHDLDGAPVRLVRRASEPPRLSEQEIAGHLERYTGPRYELARELLEFPERHPHLGALHVDRLGNVWVGGHVGEPERWSVFDTSGTWVTDVTMPEGVTVLEIGDDHLLGNWRDALGVEHLVRYALVKPPSTAFTSARPASP